MKKIISVILITILLLSAMPFTVFAGGDETELFLDVNHPLWLGTDTEMFKFTPNDDGWYKFCTQGDADTYCTLYNSNFDEIAWGDDSFDDDNFSISSKLYAGYTYYLEVGAYIEEDLATAKFDLMVTETEGVESVNITTPPDNTNCIIGFETESIRLNGLQLILTLSNEEEILWTYNKDSDLVSGCMVETCIDDDGEGHYYLDVICGEGFDRFYFDMIENPIESIDVESMSPIEIYEYSSGMYSEGNYIYSYLMPQDTMMKINYKDGTSTVESYYDQVIEGFYFSKEDDQFTAPWGVGDHEFTIEYMGCTATATVSILPCPYESVTLLSAPSRVYVYSDNETGYTYDGDYVLKPYDLTGLSFEVGYSDGTTEIIDDEDIDMDSKKINGYMYEIGEYLVSGPGNLNVTLSYKGMDIKYSVMVVESPIDSIEVTKELDKFEWEDRYHANYSGMEIKLNFKDGTEETVTVTEDNMEYVLNGSLYCYVTEDDYTICISRQFDVSTEKYYTIISCLGVKLDYYGILYVESRDVESIVKVENFAQNTDGMTLLVEYSSGVEESLTYSPVDYYDYGDDMYEGFAMTENGVTYFDTALKSLDDTSSTYRLYTLGETVEVVIPKVKLGDVDGNGVINIIDATLVQRYIAQITSLSDAQIKTADTTKDGSINIMDVTAIQRYIAQLITEF